MDRPTLLMVGSGEPMDAALRLALDRHGLFVEAVGLDNLRRSVQLTAPDLVLLLGDAAEQGGVAALSVLAGDASSAAVPVILLAPDARLESRMHAFRHGAMAVVPRSASPDAIARKIAGLTKELAEHFEERTGEIGEATFDELVDLVKKELRSGILSVHAPNHKGGPMRVVLGAGRPVAQAVHEFVARLKPHVTAADPMYYQFHTSAGGPVELLDMDGGATKVETLEPLRILLVDDDPSRADTLAQGLRARGALVFVTDNTGRGIERAVGLDPQVAILDASGLEGPGFEVVRAIRKDLRLRWASILVAPWDEIWPRYAQPGAQAMPDIDKLASRIEPLLVPERELAERARQKGPFDVRLESTGPGRMLRVLVESGATLHLTIRNPKAVVEVDLAQGLLVGAMAQGSDGKTTEGTHAIATLLSLGSGRVHIEPRANPSVANVMSPVDEALAVASAERSQTERPEAPGRASAPAPAPALDSSELRWGGAPASAFLPLDEDVPTSSDETQVKNLEGLAKAGEVLLEDARPSKPATKPTEAKPSVARPSPPTKPIVGKPNPLASKPSPLAAKPSPLATNPTPLAARPIPVAAKPPSPPPAKAPGSPDKRKRRSTIAMGSGFMTPVVSKPSAPSAPEEEPAAPPAEAPVIEPEPAIEPAPIERGAPSTDAASRDERSPDEGALEQIAVEGLASPEPPLPPPSPLAPEPATPPPALAPAPPAPPAPATPSPALAPAAPAMPSSPLPPAPRERTVARAPVDAAPRRGAGRSLAIASVVLASVVLVAVLGLIGYRYSGLRSPELDRLLVLLGAPPADLPVAITETPELPEPTPSEPTPSEAVPVEPAPTEPTEPVPSEPAPSEPEPTEPEPSEAEPTEPEPNEVEPTEPAPTEAEPTEPTEPAETTGDEPGEGARIDELLRSAARAGSTDLGERLYRRVLALDPREHHAMIGLAEILMDRNRPAEAAELLRSAVARRPRRAAYRVQLGDALAAAGDNAGARRAWEQALEVEPDNAQARRRLGQ